MPQANTREIAPSAPWALGFRPFFLGAGVVALLLVPLWVAVYSRGDNPSSYYQLGMTWHGHEMMFGYAVAVIAGFLLTAVRNWTGRDTATGNMLIALFVLWLAGRILPFFAEALPGWLIALTDLAFLPALLAALVPPLLGAQQAHNRRLLVILGLLTVANLLVHLQQLGLTQATAQLGLNMAVYLVVVLISVIVGRVLPFFTQRALNGAQPRQWPWLERLTIAVTIVLAVLLPWRAVDQWLALGCLAAAVLHGVRLAAWYDRRIWRVPILWVLHVGYAWVAIGFLLAGLSAWGIGSQFLTLHAFTVGAIGTLTLGMMARVALGHTGRELRAAPSIVLAFTLLSIAALARVLLPALVPQWYTAALMVSGVGWGLAFLLFVLLYAPILLRPRVDGLPG